MRLYPHTATTAALAAALAVAAGLYGLATAQPATPTATIQDGRLNVATGRLDVGTGYTTLTTVRIPHTAAGRAILDIANEGSQALDDLRLYVRGHPLAPPRLTLSGTDWDSPSDLIEFTTTGLATLAAGDTGTVWLDLGAASEITVQASGAAATKANLTLTVR